MLVSELNKLLLTQVGQKIPRPTGTLAGHASGLGFERLIHESLEAKYPGLVFRHFEFLNMLLHENLDCTSGADREQLLGLPHIRVLLSRGSNAMGKWSPSSTFEEKQNDTAESVLINKLPFESGDFVTLIDVKSRNLSKSAQAPNIISAEKLAKALKSALADQQVSFDLIYIGAEWEEESDGLVARNLGAKSLFLMDELPYINWSAAQQLQFHVSAIDQDFTGTRIEWAERFLKHAYESVKRHLDKKEEKFRRLMP